MARVESALPVVMRRLFYKRKAAPGHRCIILAISARSEAVGKSCCSIVRSSAARPSDRLRLMPMKASNHASVQSKTAKTSLVAIEESATVQQTKVRNDQITLPKSDAANGRKTILARTRSITSLKWVVTDKMMDAAELGKLPALSGGLGH